MKLENQVCSLELSKKLKSLNCKQDSIWYWNKYRLLGSNKLKWGIIQYDNVDIGYPNTSAFTVAELGELLPRGYMSFHNSIGTYFCEDLDTFIQPDYKAVAEDNTEANARAKMLIWLIEQGKVHNV